MDEFDKYVLEGDQLSLSTLLFLKTLSSIFDSEINQEDANRKE